MLDVLNDPKWVQEIAAVASFVVTLVLAGITAVYVVYTRRMATQMAQQNAPVVIGRIEPFVNFYAVPGNPISRTVVKPQRVPLTLTLKIPQRCPACQKLQTITLEQIIKGETVTFQWCCRACNHGWPVRRDANSDDSRSR